MSCFKGSTRSVKKLSVLHQTENGHRSTEMTQQRYISALVNKETLMFMPVIKLLSEAKRTNGQGGDPLPGVAT